MHHKILFSLGLILIFLLIHTPVFANQEVTVVFTGDTSGFVLPCG